MRSRPERPATALALITLVLASGSLGCATLFSGTTQPLTIITEPPGAQVIVNGTYVGASPVHMEVHRDKDLHVVLRHASYPEKALLLRRDFNPVAALNLVGIVCWAIDLATGAMFRVEPDTVLVAMDPRAAPAPGQLFTAPSTEFPPAYYPPPQQGPPGAPAPPAPPSQGSPPAAPPPASPAPGSPPPAAPGSPPPAGPPGSPPPPASPAPAPSAPVPAPAPPAAPPPAAPAPR